MEVKMKKTILLAIIVLLAATLLTATSAFARPGKGNLKGIITAIDYDNKNLTITTNKGESMSVVAPEGFDLEPFEIDQWVLVKGTIQEDGTIAAIWIKRVGRGSDVDNDEDKPEGSKANSAYCSEGKHVKSHPLALKIAERFSVEKDWVMGYFCD